jgi:hypothetical protein
MSTTTPSTRILTGKCRFSYPHLFQPHAVTEGGAEKYSVTLLIPKSDKETVGKISDAIAAAEKRGVSEKWGGKLPKVLRTPLWDGDGVRQNGDDFGDECKGHYVMTASSVMKPGIVDKNVEAIIDPAEIYAGMYGRVTLNFFPYEFNGNRGVGCGLNNVQKMADGESLGGMSSPTNDFTKLEDDGEPQAPEEPEKHTGRINPITGQPL